VYLDRNRNGKEQCSKEETMLKSYDRSVGGVAGVGTFVVGLVTGVEDEKVVVGLDPCGMVKEGTKALIRLGNWMALLTAEHAGLELN